MWCYSKPRKHPRKTTVTTCSRQYILWHQVRFWVIEGKNLVQWFNHHLTSRWPSVCLWILSKMHCIYRSREQQTTNMCFFHVSRVASACMHTLLGVKLLNDVALYLALAHDLNNADWRRIRISLVWHAQLKWLNTFNFISDEMTQ